MSKVGHEPSITGDVLQQHSDTERFYHVDVVNITEDDIIEIGEDVEEAILSKVNSTSRYQMYPFLVFSFALSFVSIC